MAGYGQFCPMAKAMEVLDERWTLLVVRELLLGSTHFNDLRRGNPRMSPALLSKRLRRLEHAGVIRREVIEGRTRYTLTQAGLELKPVVDALQVWGVRWVGGLGAEDLDPHLLLWDMKRTVPARRWPGGRTVVALHFSDVETRSARWWFCVRDGQVDVCDYDPGFEVDAHLALSLRTLSEIWRGDRSWATALQGGLVAVDAPSGVRRELPGWFGQSSAADVPRPVTASR
jgi:DNA-binding HxlR family transcriptional regulator